MAEPCSTSDNLPFINETNETAQILGKIKIMRKEKPDDHLRNMHFSLNGLCKKTIKTHCHLDWSVQHPIR